MTIFGAPKYAYSAILGHIQCWQIFWCSGDVCPNNTPLNLNVAAQTAMYSNLAFAGTVSERGSVAAKCRWSDWSSCSYYCGDPRVETRFKSLVEVVPKGEAAQCGMPQEKCDTACTGEASMSLAQNSPKVKGGLQRLLSGFFPLRGGGYPPFPLRVFGQNDFPLRKKSVKKQLFSAKKRQF